MRSNMFLATIALVLVAVQAAPLLNGINNGIVERNPESTGHVNDNAEVDVEKRITALYYHRGSP
ncbi:hypothetical protein BDP27DRAFT_1426553 [Rhodocollybia butyracea]|uniref:RxLR effector protein n=1 Tax=Rhodocollybia butyracea TaxID=206335 RepID=A0A9P5PDN2_9AGAR|nr:hypothetical protein BDP27DRAFT_1426553 [Rhodocollybia butyracea]